MSGGSSGRPRSFLQFFKDRISSSWRCLMLVGNLFTLLPSSLNSCNFDKAPMLLGNSNKLLDSFKCSICRHCKPSNRTRSCCLSITSPLYESFSSLRDVKQDNSFGRCLTIEPSRLRDPSLHRRPIDVSSVSILVLLKSKLSIKSDDTTNSLRLEHPLTLIFSRDSKCFSPLTHCRLCTYQVSK